MPGGERAGLEEAASHIAVAAEASTVADMAHSSQEEAGHIAEVAVVAAGVAGAYALAGARAGVPGDTSTAEGAVAGTANTRWATRKIP